MKVAISAVLALGVGLAAATTQAAATPAGGLQAALAAHDDIQLAQADAARPRGPAVRGPAVRAPAVRGPAVRGPAVRGPVGGGPVYRGAPVYRGGPGYVGRPGFVGRPGYVGGPGFYRGAYVRGYRPWYRRPYFGTIVGGIALGTIITAAAIGVPPAAPAPDLCWYWADPDQTTGYWDYCQ
jgi:hypothetical protein